MIQFVYGPDAYRLKIHLAEHVECLQREHAHATTVVFDFEELRDCQELEHYVKNRSLFDPTRSMVVKNIFFQKEAAKEFLQIMATYALTKDLQNFVVVAETAEESTLLKKNKELFKRLSASDVSVTTIPLL